MNVHRALSKLTIRINRTGSGILYEHLDDPNFYYVFTAKHCLEQNTAFCLLEYESSEQKLETIIIENNQLLADPIHDFALVLVNKESLKISDSKIPALTISRRFDDFNTYHFRGYPAALSGDATKLEATFIEAYNQGFKIRVSTNLSDSSGDLASTSVAGFSGSGVVVQVENELILVGIVTQLGNSAGSFNQIHCNSFTMINQFLQRYNLPALQFDEPYDLVEETVETIYSTLLKVNLPSKVFQAEIKYSRSELFEYAKAEGKYIPYKLENRQFVYELLKMNGLRLSGDFAVHNNKIIAFYDLSEDDNSFHYIIEKGTVESFLIEEYCDNSDRQRTLVNLINNCLNRKLHHLGVIWKHEDRTYIFAPEDEKLGKRQIKWKGKVKSERTVFEAKMQSKTNPDEPDKLWYCTHLAFQCNFRRLGHEWYLNIAPDAYATYDGFKKNFWKTKDIASYKKKKERNGEVFTHVRFLAYFLSQNMDYFVNFEELTSFDNAPKLVDNYWHIKKEKK